MKSTHNEIPSFQSLLFSYLTPTQQMHLRPILRTFKPWAQDELCCALMDYIENGREASFSSFTLGSVFCYLISPGMIEEDSEAIITPKNIERV